MIIKIGNIFESGANTIVNTVNCVGVMGKGIALEFKKRYPQMFKEYVSMCERNEVEPGKPYLYRDLLGTSVLNFPTKDHWKSPSQLSYIISGLDWFVENYDNLGIDSIAFPPLGCGNGGLPWELVGPIMYSKLKSLPIQIEIYAPYGTKPELLKPELLENSSGDFDKNVYGTKQSKHNKNWDLLMYVVQELSKNKYSLYVGRTIFQKICYIMTHEGIKTGFVFAKGSYGPYSAQIKEAITVLSNSNILQEKPYGKMIRITVPDSFVLDKSLYSEKDMLVVDKTIDLFSRIKNTEQAEMITTVLYSYDCVSKEKTFGKVNDSDVYDFVVNWKKHWKNSKDVEIGETIKNLLLLDWIDVAHSGKLEYVLEI